MDSSNRLACTDKAKFNTISCLAEGNFILYPSKSTQRTQSTLSHAIELQCAAVGRFPQDAG